MVSTAPVVVFDLEYTAWDGSQERGWSGPGEVREIVQIGAVRLEHGLGSAETADFSRLIKPVLVPQLSDYFTSLTRITQQRVDSAGVPFAEALTAFVSFAAEASLLSNGPDGDVVTENCRLLGLDCPIDSSRFRDVRERLAASLRRDVEDVDSFRLREMIGLPPTDAPHDALADARAVADALRVVTSRV